MSRPTFAGVTSVGGLLPTDMLARIADGKDVSGSAPADYHLAAHETVRDAAERRWDYLKGAYTAFRRELGDKPTPEIELTRKRWLLILLSELGFGHLQASGSGITSDDGEKLFAISHRWQQVPIHLVGWNILLDKPATDRVGKKVTAPQSTVQECLNRSEANVWAILSNGRQLRLLRDSTSLVGSAYIEFDLEAIFDGELFADFVLLFRVVHESRLSGPGLSCWLESWRTDAIVSGTRALEQLSAGVEAAIGHLGTGFIQHPANTGLREDLDAKRLKVALLNVVYRLLFLFVAEDRGILFAPDAEETARARYIMYFSSARLRRLSQRRRGGSHTDLWHALKLVLVGLGDVKGLPQIGLPALGGIFELDDGELLLQNHLIANEHLLAAIRALSVTTDTKTKRNRVIDYRNLGSEELGSIYESLLELIPKYDPAERTFSIIAMAGNDRKTTGSYYTPTSLIDCLLDSALDPVLDAAEKSGRNAKEQEAALLAVTVCDPACGSGHFLVGASRRIAKRLAYVRTGDPEPGLDDLRHALRDVVGRCVFGVDLNPMAVKLAKVSLWLEALEPGKPLGFLDAQIKHGNALLGTTPKLLADGIPDNAFKPIEGDDKKFASLLKRTNATERSGQDSLFDITDALPASNTALAKATRAITWATADSLNDVHAQAAKYHALETSAEYLKAREAADAWCAAFVWKKTPDAPRAITDGMLEDIQMHSGMGVPNATIDELGHLREEYQFFHWHLEFPQIFTVSEVPEHDLDPATGWAGGFSCVLGNPPWETLMFNDKEFFGARNAEIAQAGGAKRKRLIEELPRTNPDLAAELAQARRAVKATFHLARNSGAYPFCSKGLTDVKGTNNLKTEQLFSERVTALVARHGRIGIIVPTGIATDALMQFYFRDLIDSQSLASLYDFENAAPIFDSVHRSFKFCALTLTGRGEQVAEVDFAFFLHDPAELYLPDTRMTLTPEEINLLNPNTGTCPVFRSRRDAEITLGIYRRTPVLVKKSDPCGDLWGVSLMRMFDMSDDFHLFRTRDDLMADGWILAENIFTNGPDRMLPLHEGKMGHQFDHRAARFTGLEDTAIAPLEDRKPATTAQPRYWVGSVATEDQLSRRNVECQTALLGHRRVARSTDERTSIAALIPWGAASYGWIISSGPSATGLAVLAAGYDSFAFDFCLRNALSQPSIPQSTSEQLPMPAPVAVDQTLEGMLGTGRVWIVNRVLELTYTAYDMAPFACDLGDEGAPFRWDEERRFLLRAELDAAFFHLYSIERDDVDYIMETFPIVKRKDEARYEGVYRTKIQILTCYDAMAHAQATGTEYRTILDPPPGQGSRHPARPTST